MSTNLPVQDGQNSEGNSGNDQKSFQISHELFLKFQQLQQLSVECVRPQRLFLLDEFGQGVGKLPLMAVTLHSRSTSFFSDPDDSDSKFQKMLQSLGTTRLQIISLPDDLNLS
jgi:hypothetical protein